MPPQGVDGEVDMKVEFKALGFGVCVFYLRRNIISPKFEEHFVVSIIKGGEEVFLENAS